MKLTIKRISRILLSILLLITLVFQNTHVVNAANSAIVYEYSTMLVDKGNIYYIQTVEGDNTNYNIFRLEISSGKKTKLISTNSYILNMVIHKSTLYYTCYNSEKEAYYIYSVSINGKSKATVCAGNVICIDDSGIYYDIFEGENSKLYKRNFKDNSDTIIFTGNMSLQYIKEIDKTFYFSHFNQKSSVIELYTLLQGGAQLTRLTTDKVTLNETERNFPLVSDIAKINGDLYYQYGSYEGTGNFWYGTLKKLDIRTNKKSVIAKNLYDAHIYHDQNNIYYSGIESNAKYYYYNSKTNKTISYTCNTSDNESLSILGNKTYSAKVNGKDKVTISRFTSGTNKKNLIEPFIRFTYKQTKSLNYYVSVKQYGKYLIIPVNCMDYNDYSYGWRGKCVSITWYVADQKGNILSQFK